MLYFDKLWDNLFMYTKRIVTINEQAYFEVVRLVTSAYEVISYELLTWRGLITNQQMLEGLKFLE